MTGINYGMIGRTGTTGQNGTTGAISTGTMTGEIMGMTTTGETMDMIGGIMGVMDMIMTTDTAVRAHSSFAYNTTC